MVSTTIDFEEEIAWERTVLALAVPLIPRESSDQFDLRTGTLHMQLSASIGGHAAEAMRDSLLPLLFGAAWKILDLSVELALANDNKLPTNKTRWLIKEKGNAIKTAGFLLGIPVSSDVWSAIRELYLNTTEPRHALVHRRVTVDSSSRNLTCFDMSANPLLSLTTAEQLAFCRATQRLADAITMGSLPARAALDFRAQLKILQPHHGIALAGDASNHPPVKLLDNLPASNQLDVLGTLAAAQKKFPADNYFDLVLYVADGRRILAELDRAPKQVVILDLNNLPPWARFI